MHAVGDEYHQLKSVFDYFIHLQNWSLILVLPPKENTMADDYASKMHEMIMEEIALQGLKNITHVLGGESYRLQYQEAHHLVDEILKDGKDN